MILQHYLQLLRHYRTRVLGVVFASTILAALGSFALLSVAPKYTAAASVAVLPTEAEYSFGRDNSAGPRSTARGLTATYIEYLKSRPVVEGAIDKIGPKMLAGGTATGRGWIGNSAAGLVDWLQRTYRRLDSGRYVTPDARESALSKLMDAITLETVADSYVLRVEVTLSSPEAAAASANALAEAYVQRVSEQLATSVGLIGGFLQQQIVVREAELKALTARQDQLRTGVGTTSLEAEQSRLLTTRETERQKLVDAQAEIQAAEAELAVLSSENIVQSGRGVAELSAARAVATSRREAALKNLELRRRSVDQITATLDALRSKEEPIASVDRQLGIVKQELAELRGRVLSTDLSRSSAMTQVRVIDPAVVPVYPSSPHVVQDTVLGLVVGFLVSLMLIVLVDTVSDRLRTTTDLARIAGRRALGALPRALARRLGRKASWDHVKVRDRLKTLGTGLERGLAVVGAFDAPSIQVTGFAAEGTIADAASLIAAALAARGARVFCRLPATIQPRKALQSMDAAALRFAHEEPDERSAKAIRIDTLGPVSAELSFAEVVRRSPALVCVVPAGETAEREIGDFQDAALGAGISALSMVLLEA